VPDYADFAAGCDCKWMKVQKKAVFPLFSSRSIFLKQLKQHGSTDKLAASYCIPARDGKIDTGRERKGTG